MAAIRAQVVLHTVDAVPANFVTNSFCFMGTDPGADTTGITTAIKDFYDDITSGYWSSVIAPSGHEVKYYDLPGTTPNYPIEEDTFALGFTPSGTPLPSEVALCLSFHGARTPGFPQARRRGRIYFGPLSSSANSSGRPIAALVTAMANAATTFKANIEALGTGTEWAVWSVADQAPVDITGGWVDNVFDTQRRRGLVETSRTTW